MSSRTPEQQATLEMIYEADQKWRTGKRVAEAQIRTEVDARVAALKMARDDAVIEGLQRGLSKGVIGRQGLSTTDPAAVNKVIAMRAPELAAAQEDYNIGPLTWVDRETEVVKVAYLGYPGEYADPKWTGNLKGLVQRDPSSPYGWKVLTDHSDEQTEFGTLPGFLRLTVEGGGEPLISQLNTWAVTH